MFDVKKNLKWIAGAGLGLFHFIFMALSFITVGSGYFSLGLTGYDSLSFDNYDGANMGFIIPLLHILTLIAGIVLLAVSAYILIGELAANINLPDSFGGLKVKALGNLTWLIWGGINAALFLFAVIFCIANEYTTPGIGAYLMLILNVGGVVALVVLEKKMPHLFADNGVAGGRRFVCGNCGANAKAGSAFCQVCGGQVVEVAPPPQMIYFCENCRKPAKQGVPFCSACGGRIVCAPKPVFVCEVCNSPSKPGVAFCSKCGGRIISK